MQSLTDGAVTQLKNVFGQNEAAWRPFVERSQTFVTMANYFERRGGEIRIGTTPATAYDLRINTIFIGTGMAGTLGENLARFTAGVAHELGHATAPGGARPGARARRLRGEGRVIVARAAGAPSLRGVDPAGAAQIGFRRGGRMIGPCA
jgi:hypothetical protein